MTPPRLADGLGAEGAPSKSGGSRQNLIRPNRPGSHMELGKLLGPPYLRARCPLRIRRSIRLRSIAVDGLESIRLGPVKRDILGVMIARWSGHPGFQAKQISRHRCQAASDWRWSPDRDYLGPIADPLVEWNRSFDLKDRRDWAADRFRPDLRVVGIKRTQFRRDHGRLPCRNH